MVSLHHLSNIIKVNGTKAQNMAMALSNQSPSIQSIQDNSYIILNKVKVNYNLQMVVNIVDNLKMIL